MSTDPSAANPARRGRVLTGFAVAVVLLWAVDQATKIWAVARLEGQESITLIPHLLGLRFLRNPGAAFGLGGGMTALLSVVAIVVVVVVVRLAPRLQDRVWRVAFVLLLAGAIGNLTDRLFRAPEPLHGHVVDFIDYAGYFVGNIADIYLTVAAVLVLCRSWQGIGFDGQRETPRRAGSGHASE